MIVLFLGFLALIFAIGFATGWASLLLAAFIGALWIYGAEDLAE